jgi:threonine/homoserine/homoserine lactone efflux protein
VADGFTSSLAAFALTSLIIELTPGPNMAYLAALSLSRGTRAGISAVLGIMLGLALFGIAAAVGVATLILQSTVLYETLRWAGVVYLLWLAWEGWVSEHDVTADASASPGDTPWYAFRRGLITNLLNPKAGIFYVATLPRFVDAGASNVTHQAIMLSAIYVSIATLVHLTIVLLAGRLFAVLETPDSRRMTRRVLSLALVFIAVWFAFSTRR